MATPKEIIRHYCVKPRKRLGQSFLLDKNIIRKIAVAARISPEDVVIEIGPGTGVLTEEIVSLARRVIAVELDEKLVRLLENKFADCGNIEVRCQDILKFNFSLPAKKHNVQLKVVGNVPYYLSSPLVFYLLSYRRAISDFTLMLQKEVVDRLIASPNNKNYGVPSVLLQMFTEVERLFDVPETCFYPRPKVTSSVIQGKFREKPLVDIVDEEIFSRLVKAAFAQRRKMLINNLKRTNLLTGWTDEELNKALNAVGIDGKRRAETLSVCEFGRLCNILATGKKTSVIPKIS
ncbi:MAG: 16S rRNA (adenine(1518)-N(6)/adenine(1519)-N(6))-dimethyltransferase RsmA [Smithellaceae bacterium]|jgi:16S rRNA (adenine1518-N6/adenine1519-N6)-dimethyltransferase|nr:ribosomal RNA small subunit methyltransferase A [Syntrophaceae bacterium]MDX9816843.1 16S rRNA (adenine(1518)-N(6)/adenine(1519)-N(6))-dimethyltransferase RsmA [Smithellaceae bacterium]NMD05421.1 ribosomal RNA small subunit methyltransferase A [Deltaproteobacteria bacterium]MBP8609636.1 ribosomal RNA small subunit methyltransferase A [Syntrophaceae bacterium]HNV64825.1 16S rRNA (adenine(1518)-N(6)/adenine(1519)-N(6))-dimethyltransferase RsmA [Smithellaceae bacterium]